MAEAGQAQPVGQCQRMVLSETRGLWLYGVVRGGLECRGDSDGSGTGPNGWEETHPRTRASAKPKVFDRGEGRRRSASLPSDAQAACGFKCSALKRSPFFQRVKTRVASFRATITRAISASFPVASGRA